MRGLEPLGIWSFGSIDIEQRYQQIPNGFADNNTV